MILQSFRYENPLIPVVFSFAGESVKGFLTECTGKKNWWFLHSDDKILIDVLIYENKRLRWQANKGDLPGQMEYFKRTLTAWYK